VMPVWIPPLLCVSLALLLGLVLVSRGDQDKQGLFQGEFDGARTPRPDHTAHGG
jgi:hypothetical protein